MKIANADLWKRQQYEKHSLNVARRIEIGQDLRKNIKS